VEEAHFEGEHVQPNGRVTVSIGEASLPRDAEQFDDLIQKADMALYEAKHSGRNQVKSYSPALNGGK
jgi:diguanylate cyclase (GGDEF)-like protein